MPETSVIILAAGQGTRMRSALPKVLHPLLGKPMIRYSIDSACRLSFDLPVVVVGHGAEEVRAELGAEARFAVQEQQLGTAHAVMAAESILSGHSDLILVFYADMPLLRADTLKSLLAAQEHHSGPISMLTVELPHPHGFGRIVRDGKGKILAIVEEAQATPEQRAIRELNVGVYCFQASWLWPALHRIPLSPKGEYYLTDLVGLAVADGLPVQSMAIEDPAEATGINNRVHLAEAGEILRVRINQEWMMAGVTIIDPRTTYVDSSVALGRDTVIWPNTYIRGKTSIGANCAIGPNAIIDDCQIGDGCTVLASVMEKAVMEEGSEIGPFGRLRKGAHLGVGVHMGNFGEVKNSFLGAHSKMGHFSYIGDATIGENVNIGAGTITCNYDGVRKAKTEIGDDVFIGSDTMLVAPLKIGKGAHTGAGAVVTHDVAAHELVVGVPARPLRKKESPKQSEGKDEN